MSGKARNVLADFYKRTDIDWENSMEELKQQDLQILEQAKSNAMYNSVARRNGFNCTLDGQDINKGF